MIRRARIFLTALTLFALVAPWLAPYDAAEAFQGFLHAPPMRPHLDGLAPVVHPLVLADRLEQRFEPDRSRTVRLPWVQQEAGAPVLGITGSNGKTTVVRLLAAMATEAGRVAGTTTTDGVAIQGRVIEESDFSGPSGARMLLRRPEVETAVLETARGGLLRRGLAVEHARAAVLTNIAADHLGEFGVQTLAELAETKLLVARAVGAGGRVVLNADEWRRLAFSLGLDWQAPASLSNEAAREAVLKRLEQRAAHFPRYAVPRAVVLSLEPWTVENTLLTPTLKLKRLNLQARFEQELAAMYASRPRA